MVVDRQYIQNLRSSGMLVISKEKEELLLKKYGTEPLPDVWSEQDLWEQIRKELNQG